MPIREVDLRSLKPNPLRNMRVDPLDKTAIAKLKQSIEEDDFWGGVVCAEYGDEVVIAAGHHRVEAAIQAGHKRAHLFVKPNADPEFLLRVYARENATQRGAIHGTSLTGAIASALKVIAKALLDESEEGPDLIAKILAISRTDGEQVTKWRKALEGEGGLGRSAFLACKALKDVPGIHKESVDDQLENLKSSGNYKRIVAEARRELAEELKARAKAAKAEEAQRLKEVAAKAERKAAKAKKDSDEQEIEFDLEGVNAVLKEPRLVRAFRQAATDPAVTRYLPVKNQAALAQRIKELGDEFDEGELTTKKVAEWVDGLARDAKGYERKLRGLDQQKPRTDDYHRQFKQQWDALVESLRTLNTQSSQLASLIRLHPTVLVESTASMRNQVASAIASLTKLQTRLDPDEKPTKPEARRLTHEKS